MKIFRIIFVYGWNLYGFMENKKIYSYVSEEVFENCVIEVYQSIKWFYVYVCICNYLIFKN